MDAALSRSTDDAEPHHYAVVSGGVRSRGPSAFLYSIPKSDITAWTFLGHLVDVDSKAIKTPWTGERGLNWECFGYFDLSGTAGDEAEGSKTRSFIMGGTEGGPRDTVDGVIEHEDAPARTPRWQVWLSGPLVVGAEGGAPQMVVHIEGTIDPGCFYAGQTFSDGDRRLLIGESGPYLSMLGLL